MRIIDKNKEEKAKELLDDVKIFLKSKASLKNCKFPLLFHSGGIILSKNLESKEERYRFKKSLFDLEKVKKGLKNLNIIFDDDSMYVKIGEASKIEEDSLVISGNEFRSAIFQVLAESLITTEGLAKQLEDEEIEDMEKTEEINKESGEGMKGEGDAKDGTKQD